MQRTLPSLEIVGSAHTKPSWHDVNAVFAPPPQRLHGGVGGPSREPPSPPRSRILPEHAAIEMAAAMTGPMIPRALICMSMIVVIARLRHGIDARLESTLGMNKLLGDIVRKRAARARASS